jgi:hypothetical protein
MLLLHRCLFSVDMVRQIRIRRASPEQCYALNAPEREPSKHAFFVTKLSVL